MGILTLGLNSGRSPCVLIHGAMRTGRWEWWPIAVRLARHRKVILVDLPGHGSDRTPPPVDFDTMTAQLVELVQSVPGPVHLVGHSNGGSLVLAALPRVAERVASAVVQGGNATVSQGLLDAMSGSGIEELRTKAAVAVRRYERIHTDWEALLAASHSWTIGGPNLSPGMLANVRTSTLVVEGVDDELNVGLGHGAYIANHLPEAELWEPLSGHDVHHARPNEWVDRVERFIASHDHTSLDEPAFTTTRTVPMKLGPSESSQQVTQILPGELVTVSRREDVWVQARHVSSGYPGWVEASALVACDNRAPVERWQVIEPFVGGTRSNGIDAYPIGTEVEPTTDANRWRLRDGTEGQIPTAYLAPPGNRSVGEDLTLLLRLVGTPYVWGGRTERGIDCSGLSQLFWRLRGVDLPRDSWEQFEALVPCDDSHVSGDLAFFADPGTGPTARISHVAVYLGSNRIVHAFGPAKGVVVDYLDELASRERPPSLVGWGRPAAAT